MAPFSSRTLFSISRNHLEEKKLYFGKCIYIGNLDPAVMTMPFGGDTVRYKDVTNRPVAAPTFLVNRNTALGTGSVLVDMLSVQQRPR